MIHPYVYAGLDIALRNHTKQTIINTILEFFNITHRDIANKSKVTKIVYHRQLVHYFLIKRGLFKPVDITLAIKGIEFDRTSVMHSCKAIQDYYDTYEYKRKEIDKLDELIKDNLKATTIKQLYNENDFSSLQNTQALSNI